MGYKSNYMLAEIFILIIVVRSHNVRKEVYILYCVLSVFISTLPNMFVLKILMPVSRIVSKIRDPFLISDNDLTLYVYKDIKQ